METIDRFLAKVDKTDNCWNWTAFCDTWGYGQFRYGSRVIQAHRYSYLNFVGDLIEGLVVDHLCSNRKCVNPSHLEQVTQKQNVMRARSKVTHCPSGHEYDAIKSNGKSYARSCKTCHAKAVAKYQHNNKEKINKQQRERYQKKKSVSGT
tara:strand:- start:276 stop:725 length:450 start_codon:yes stop_codon:yes gene_type:complete